jgi:hypothetical protein
MSDKPIGERVASLETGLSTHLETCERLQERNFRLLLIILAGLIGMAAKLFGAV